MLGEVVAHQRGELGIVFDQQDRFGGSGHGYRFRCSAKQGWVRGLLQNLRWRMTAFRVHDALLVQRG
jgi:hypothetical protein